MGNATAFLIAVALFTSGVAVALGAVLVVLAQKIVPVFFRVAVDLSIRQQVLAKAISPAGKERVRRTPRSLDDLLNDLPPPEEEPSAGPELEFESGRRMQQIRKLIRDEAEGNYS